MADGLSKKDLGCGLMYRLEAVQDVLLEREDTKYDRDFLIVGKHPDYPNKRSLIQFQTPIIESGQEIDWAKMYLYYWYAHKAGWHTVYQTKYISRTLQVHQVKKDWIEGEATSVLRRTGVAWSRQYLALDGSDADERPLDAVTIYTDRPEGYVEFDVTGAVRNWEADKETNYGLLIWATNEKEEGRDLRFHGRKKEEQYRPFIRVLCKRADPPN